MDILRAISDPNVFASHFRDRKSWQAWFVFLAALFGLPLTPEQLEIYQACTGRKLAPLARATEAWLVCGRRAGKSFILALTAVFLACFFDWRPYLGPGKRGTIMVIAADRKQARVIMRYIRGLLKSVPMLSHLIEAERIESLDLSNRITIEVHSASFRTTRGYTIVAALLDELAFWRSEEDASNPDHEIISAIKPAMATIPDAMQLCASSPYARKGSLWDAYHRYFGKEGSILVWQAATRIMNPLVPQSFIDGEYEKDPISADAEFGAQFRSDIESFVSREAVEAVTDWSVQERGPIGSHRYAGWVDPSGGSADSMALAIAHKEGEIGVVDCLREAKPPFSPEGVVSEFADVLKRYRISKVTGDRYAGEWPREQFRKYGIKYEQSKDPKGTLYLNLLPLVNSAKVRLLGSQRLVSQLIGLERQTARSGKDSIDHARGAHDDVANAVAGALLAAMATRPQIRIGGYGYGGPVHWHDKSNQLRLRDSIRFARVNENGEELTAEEACALRHTLPGQQFRKEEEDQNG
jgi:hypothetical protein